MSRSAADWGEMNKPVQLFSSDDNQPAFIAVGMQPVGVIAIGIVPIGIIAIACGGARGIVAISCGGAIGIFTAACGVGVGVVTAVVGMGVGAWAVGGWSLIETWTEGRSGPIGWPIAKIALGAAIIVGSWIYFGAGAWQATRIAVADHRVDVVWHGVVRESEGMSFAPNTPCEVSATFRGDGQALLAAHLAVGCGHLALYESGDISSGSVTVMNSDDLGCSVTQIPHGNGSYVYAARCQASPYRGHASSGTGQFPSRPGLELDTRAHSAVLQLDGAGGMHVEIAIDEQSSPVLAAPLYHQPDQ